MRTFFRPFRAALAAAAWTAAVGLAAEPASPFHVVDGSQLSFRAPADPVQPAKTDAPVEVPGLPPLPPVNSESSAVPEPAHEGPSCSPWGGFYADFEFLYLKPHRQSLDYAIASPVASNVPVGSIQSDPWHARGAFRVGAGYRLPEDNWDVGFFYTYLHDDQTAGLTSPPVGQLFATQTHPGTVEFVNRANADAALSYNVYDIEIGRTMDVSQRFAVRPFGGVRFADINQNFTILYDGADANRDVVGSRIKFDGAGVRVGGQADWKVLDHVSFYGRAAGSLMVGDFSVQQNEFNNNGTTPLTNVQESFRKVTPVLEMGIGVAYHTDHFRVSVGYELTNWFNLVDTPSFVSDVDQGKYQRNISDLGVEGLAVKAEVTY